MTTDLKIQMGLRIRNFRIMRSMNRDHFAERVNLSPQFLADVENGKKGLSAESMFKICSRSNISADYLLFGENYQSENMSLVEMMLQDTPLKYQARYVEILRIMNTMIREREQNDDKK